MLFVCGAGRMCPECGICLRLSRSVEMAGRPPRSASRMSGWAAFGGLSLTVLLSGIFQYAVF